MHDRPAPRRPGRLAALALLAIAGGAGAGSPLDAPSPLEIRLLGQSEWLAGSRAAIRVTVRDAERNRPLEADLGLMLVPESGAPIALYQGRTSTLGTVDLSLRVPAVAPGRYRLRADVGSAIGRDRLEHELNVAWSASARLRTDRKVYAPGDTVAIHALLAQEPGARPAARLPLPIEVLDPRGNRVLRRTVESSEWGIVSLQLALAPEALAGSWRVRATLPHGMAERRFEVAAPPPHGLGVELRSDRPWAITGETLTGRVLASDAAGRPAGGATFSLEARSAATGEPVASTSGRLGPDGGFRYSLPLPGTVTGPERSLDTLVVLARVADGARRRGEARAAIALGAQPLDISLAIEGGLAPGAESTLLVAISRPDGQPVAGARVETRLGSEAVARVTDALGVAELRLIPARLPVRLHLEAIDSEGRSATRAVELGGPAPGPIARAPDLVLSLDRSVARVGESVTATVSVSARGGTEPVLLDLLAGGQTVLTRALAGGRGSATIALAAELVGVVELVAYRLDSSDQRVGVVRRLLVLPSADLQVRAVADRTRYAPGATARLAFETTDARGVAALAALAIEAWPEATAAPAPLEPLAERLEVGGGALGATAAAELPLPVRTRIAAAAAAEPGAARERALRFVLASLPPAGSAPMLRANSRSNRLEASKQRWRRSIDSDAARIQKALERYNKAGQRGRTPLSGQEALGALVRLGLLLPREAMDPWGRHYRASIDYGWLASLTSVGPDGRIGGGDDVTWPGGAAAAREPTLAGTHDARPSPLPPSLRPAPQPPPEAWLPELLSDERGHVIVELVLPETSAALTVNVAASSRPGGLGGGRIVLPVATDLASELALPPRLAVGDEILPPLVLRSRALPPAGGHVAVSARGAVELREGGGGGEVDLAATGVQSRPLKLAARAAGQGELAVELRSPGGDHTRRVPIEVVAGHFAISQSLAGALDRPLEAPPLRQEGSFASSTRVRVHAGPQALASNALRALAARPIPGRTAAVAELRLSARLARASRGAGLAGSETARAAERALQRWLAHDPQAGAGPASDVADDAGSLALSLLALAALAQADDLGGEALERTRDALLATAVIESGALAPEATADLRPAALAAWALAEGGGAGAQLDQALARLERRAAASEDVWALAALLEALLAAGRSGAPVSGLSARLARLAAPFADVATATWTGIGPTPTGAVGTSAGIETAALAAAALGRTREGAETARAILAGLATRLAPDGSLGGPWATALTGEALVAVAAAPGPGALPTVSEDGRALDLGGTFVNVWETRELVLGPAAGTIVVGAAPGGTLAQVVRLGQTRKPAARPLPTLALEVRWEHDSIAFNEPLEARIEAAVRADRPARDVVVAIGLPPGFEPDAEELEALVASGAIAAWASGTSGVTLRVARIEPGKPFRARIHASPAYPLAAQAPPSEAWEQANPEDRALSSPGAVRVREPRGGR